ncbi:PilN domain-containing protein [Paraburkholderia dilworthii]|uniref:PilN domain-containing protein n=1 Tax=Paraburkholderia dilworthii TaxID=948106 RepID=UPI0004084FDD|nr:fimbrial assembly protein [Paraburkholderia dilworthii]
MSAAVFDAGRLNAAAQLHVAHDMRRLHAVRPFKLWLGGFNLLPHRQRKARLARRRCLFAWTVAAFAGCTAVVALAGYQALEKARLDAQRASVEQSLAQLAAPLTEHARVLRARDQQRDEAARAKHLSEPLTYLRDLLDVLSFEPGDGVLLQQLRQRGHETELAATSRAHFDSAQWLKRLGAIPGVAGAEMSESHRSSPHADANAGSAGAIEFGARLRWEDSAKDVARGASLAASSKAKADQIGGSK